MRNRPCGLILARGKTQIWYVTRMRMLRFVKSAGIDFGRVLANAWVIAVLLCLLLSNPSLLCQQVPVQEFVLENGFTLLMVPRQGDPNIAAGWIAKVGSVNEHPGITGVSHLFEHMMFKGTHTIGTRDIEADLRLIEQIDEARIQLRQHEEEQIRRLRLGEIMDLKNPKGRAPEHQALAQRISDLQAAQSELLIKNEFDKIYKGAGASGMNAGTSYDYTIYYINVPANKLELWFWMESDRLLQPVFREFYTERNVVFEERRLSTDSTPTGRFDEQFNALSWASSPYSWPILGWPSDLDGLTRAEALSFFDVYYAPNNLIGCLVGDFDPARAIELADRYFGRLKRNPRQPDPVRTREVSQLAERRMLAYAETNPQVQVRYRGVADGHKDEPALVVLGSLLSGRTGRLYKSLVVDSKIANSAGAGQNGYKYEGFFELRAVAKQGVAPEEVEKALYAEIDLLQNDLVKERELQKVKNRFAAGNYRRLQSNFALMVQLLVAESNRGWETFNTDPKAFDAVTAEQIRNVAKVYFQPERRSVAVFYTKDQEGTEENPLLSGLNAQQKQRVEQVRIMLPKLPLERAKDMLDQLQQQQQGNAPEAQAKMLEVLERLLRERIDKGEAKP